MIKKYLYLLISALLFVCEMQAQPIMMDEAIEAGGLFCFPVYGDSTTFRYLPSDGRLAVGEDRLPEFSYLRFVTPRENTETSIKTISEASGGGILHFLVLYDTPDNQVRRAEIELRNKLENQDITLKGPVLFDKGSYYVISSILGENGEEEKKMIGKGQAPVFQNSKVAFSFSLSPTNSKILLESFKMATPDVSIMFDLSFSGLTKAYDAELSVDWAEVQKSTYSRKKFSAIFYSKEVEETFGELKRNGAIKLTTAGSDSIMGDILNNAYDRLLDMMFAPAKPEELPAQEDNNIAQKLFSPNGWLGSSIGGSNIYKKKVVKTSGVTTVSLNSRYNTTRDHLITFNIGDVYEKFGDNEKVFKTVSLEDPAFQQRDVFVGIDGDLKKEFETLIKNVSISLKKKHENGKETLREIFLSKEVLEDYKGPISMIYLNEGDQDRTNWLNYEYQLIWNFGAEGGYSTPWMANSSPIINLYAPYKRHTIQLDGDWSRLKEEAVRAVSVSVEYPFFGETKKQRITLRPGDDILEKQFEFILPADQEEIDYSVSWIKRSGGNVSFSGKDKFGLIFFDEKPSEGSN